MQYYVWHLFCRSNTLRYGSIDATCGYWGKWWKPQDVVVLEEKLSGFAAWRWVFFREYAEVLNPRLELANYLRLGGFPAVHLQKYTSDEVYTIVKDIYNSTIFTDIVRRNQIRKVDQLERIVKFAFDNVGRTFSAVLFPNI